MVEWEWIHDDGLGAVVVGISTKDDKTEIDVSATRSGEVGLLFGLGIPMGGLVSGAALANLFGVVGTGAAPAIAAAMAGVAYGVVRLVWRARSRWWEGRLQRITDRLSSTIQNVAVAPVETPEDHESGNA